MDHVSNLTLAPERTLAELTDETFLRDFAAEVGVDLLDLRLSADGDQQAASMTWSFRTDKAGIPELARRFLPAEVQLTWGQSWGPLVADSATGRLSVELLGRPSATSTGACRVAPRSGGTTLTTTTSTKAALPFPVAGRVEGLIDRDLVGWILVVQARVLQRRAAEA